MSLRAGDDPDEHPAGDTERAGPALAAVVLAAGEGRRFAGDGHKLLADWRGRPLVRVAVDAAVEAGIGPVWVVAGAVDLRGVMPAGVEILDNPRWADGQATSLAVAVDAAAARGLAAVAVGLGDQPLVAPGAWRAVAGGPGPIVVATYDGQRRNPVRLDREVWPLLRREGDEGARTLLRQRPELVREVACPGSPLDIDTREDLTRWN